MKETKTKDYVTWTQIKILLICALVISASWFLALRPMAVLIETNLDRKDCLQMAQYKYGSDVKCYANTKPMYSKLNTPTTCNCLVGFGITTNIEVS